MTTQRCRLTFPARVASISPIDDLLETTLKHLNSVISCKELKAVPPPYYWKYSGEKFPFKPTVVGDSWPGFTKPALIKHYADGQTVATCAFAFVVEFPYDGSNRGLESNIDWYTSVARRAAYMVESPLMHEIDTWNRLRPMTHYLMLDDNWVKKEII